MKMYKLICLIATLVVCHFNMHAQKRDSYQLLWKISKPGTAVSGYLFGTMHINWQKAYDMSDSVLLALDACEIAAFEVDLDSANSMISELVSKPRSSGKSYSQKQAKDQVMAKIYEDHDYLNATAGKTSGYSESAFYDANSPYHQFLDYYLFSRAKAKSKSVVGLEKIADHMSALFDYDTLDYEIILNDSAHYNDFKRRFTAQYVARNNFSVEEMVDWYWEGSLDSIANELNSLGIAGQSDMYGLHRRNITMSSRMESLLQNGTCFFAIGAGHLAGEKGVIALLKSKGCVVRPVQASFTGIAQKLLEQKFSTTRWREIKDDELGIRMAMPQQPTLMPQNGAMLSIDVSSMRAYGYSAEVYFPEKHNLKILEADARSWLKKYSLEANDTCNQVQFADGNAIEIACSNRSAIGIYRFYHKGDSLYRVFASGSKGSQMRDDDTKYFFNSIKFYAPNHKTELSDANELTFPQYGFKVEVAGKPVEVTAMQEYSNNLSNDLKRIKITDAPRGFNYELRVNLLKPGKFNTIESASEDVMSMLEIVKQVTEKLEFSWITSDTMVDQMHIYDIVGTNITTVSGMRMIYRGGYAYTLVADVPLNRISELYSFFNSFEVLPLSEENYTAPVTEPDWFKIPSPIQAQLEYGLALENFLIPVIETKSYVGLDAKSGQSFEAYHFVVDSLSFNTNEKAMEMVDFAIQDYLYSYGDSIIEDMDLGPFCKRISIIDAERKETYTAAVLLTGKDIFVTLSSINRETATLPQVSEWMAFPFGKAPKKEPTYNEVHWQEYYSRLKNSNAQNAASLYQSLAFLPLFDLSFGQLDSMLMLNLADSMVNVDMIYLLSDAMFAQDENRTLKTLANKFSSNSNYDSRTAALYQIASRQNANSTMQLFALLPEMQTNVDLNPIYEFYEMDSLKYVHPFMQAFQVMLPTYDYLYNDLAYIIANEENRETLDVLLHPKIVGHLVDYSIQLRSNWSADSDEIVDTYFTQINMAFVANALRKAAQYENARSELANYLSGQYSEQAQVEALIFAIENNDPKTLPMESVQQLADNPEYMAVVVDIFQQHGLLNMLSKKITNQKTICEKFLGRLEIEGFDNSCQLDMVGKFDYEGKAYNYYVFHYSEDPSNYAICGPFPKGGMLVTTLDENNIQVGTFETNSKKELKVIVEEIMKTSLRDGLVRY